MSCKKDYAQDESGASNSQKPVEITQVAQLTETVPVIATGRVASKEEVVLSFKTGGILRRLEVEEGQEVKQGQRLARLDLQEVEAQLAAARYNYEKSVRDAERAGNLYRDTVGTLENYQNAQTQRDLAQAQLNIAEFNRRYSVINAPISGAVLQRFVEEGELVSPGTAIYKIGSTGSTRAKIVRFGLSDRDLLKLQLGDTGTVSFSALPRGAAQSYPVQVTEISETTNPQTGLFEVEVAFTQNPTGIKNGMVGNVSLIPSQNDEGLKIPLNALVEGSGRQAMIYYTLDQQQVRQQKVSVLDIGKDYFLIDQNSLPAQAAVVVKGAPYLRDNDMITLANEKK